MKHLGLISAAAREKEKGGGVGAPLHTDTACFNISQPRSRFLCIKQVGREKPTSGRRCEDKESGEEQKVNVANKKAYMCLENTEGCLHRSLAIVYFVTSDLMQDLSAIGRVPCHSQPGMHRPVVLCT